jgi:hypothetical protein
MNTETSTVFLHAHLQVVYYKCAKFHKNPISRLGGVALTRYMDGRGDSYIPPQTLFAGGIINVSKSSSVQAQDTSNPSRLSRFSVMNKKP